MQKESANCIVYFLCNIYRLNNLQYDVCFHFAMQQGGNLAILADRFLYEVAFKLWKAPKYGA